MNKQPNMAEGLPYTIAYGWEGLFDCLSESVPAYAGRKILIVSDSNTAPLFLSQVVQALKTNPFHACEEHVVSCVIPAGEQSKNLDSLSHIYHVLKTHRFDRHDLILALGGGMIGDLAGFAAATYMRGIDYVQLPTTLLSMADSGIGGKTAVDFEDCKNMIGCFHFPVHTYVNLHTLDTLPYQMFCSGMAEILKACVLDGEQAVRLAEAYAKEMVPGAYRIEEGCLKELILTSVRLKHRVVTEDPKEQGLRMILNLGHTIGHAAESMQDYRMPHGFCVAAGLAGAVKLSVRRGLLPEETAGRIIKLLDAYGLPTEVKGIDIDRMLLLMHGDKKNREGQIRMVLLKALGKPVLCDDLREEELKDVLRTWTGISV